MGLEDKADGVAANAADPEQPGKAGAPKPSPQAAGKGVGKPDDDSSGSAADAADLEAQIPPEMEEFDGVESGINVWAISTVVLGLVLIIGACWHLGLFTKRPAPKGVCLLLIDPQVDFHESKKRDAHGNMVDAALPISVNAEHGIAGADADTENLIAWINDQGAFIDNITVSLDSHIPRHISNGCFWRALPNQDAADDETVRDGEGPKVKKPVARPALPFTSMKLVGNDIIGEHYDGETKLTSKHTFVVSETAKELPIWKEQGLDGAEDEYAKDYLRKLHAANRRAHTIWPEHCIMGDEGHNVFPALQKALDKWQADYGRKVDYVRKGRHPLMEMYSVFKAEVPFGATAYEGAYNQSLLDAVTKHKQIIVAGQALSHCVNESTRDLIKGIDKLSGERSTVYVLKNCCSSVGATEEGRNAGKDFIKFIEKEETKDAFVVNDVNNFKFQETPGKFVNSDVQAE